jgi:large subunit ribosomal protein L46
MPVKGHRLVTSLGFSHTTPIIHLVRGRPNRLSICKACASSLIPRRFSQAAAAVNDSSAVEASSQAPTEAHRICASVVLSRPPQITRDLHPFEQAFYLYQKRLNERLALPFTRFLWYKKDSPALLDFRHKLKDRLTPARDIGKYDAYGEEAWNDEALVGALEGDREHQMEKLLGDEVVELPGDEKKIRETKEQAEALRPRPMPRTTQSDVDGDVQSLNRFLQRTLYLLVQNSEGRWQFPTAPVAMAEKETLHAVSIGFCCDNHLLILLEAAERVLLESVGDYMNTWVVGNNPIGHIPIPYSGSAVSVNERGHDLKGDLVFFMKGRIMAGRVDLSKTTLGYKSYRWLAKEELQPLVHKRYWAWVRDMLPER